MLEFVTNPIVECLGGDRHILKDDFIVKYYDFTFIIPEGMITDFASVPRIPVAYLLFADKAKKSAVWHDWIYGNAPEGFTRKMADEAFLCGMESEGLGYFTRHAMYMGVRIGGVSHYHQ